MTVAATTSGTAAERPAATWSSRVPVKPVTAWSVLIAGVVGFVASWTLTVERIMLLENSSFVPSCDLNPVLSCGSVMVTPQAQAFGFPNPLMGIVAFTVVVVTGVLAVARVGLPQWYWSGLAFGTLLGAGFVHWLIYSSLYSIGALCPYCMVVWAVTILLLVITASVALRPLAENSVAQVLYRWRWSLVTLWFTAVILLILMQFWYYWSTLI